VSSLGVILDACVLIPAALRDTLLRTAAAALYRLHWSEDILAEVERNLVEHKMTSAAGAKHVVGAMREAFPEADVDGYQRLIPAMANHEKDRHILAAAVVSGAQVIVTMNLKDFPGHALAPFGIEAQSPDEFLGNLFDLDPELMIEIVKEQAEDLVNPPMSVDELLDGLAIQTPHFAGLVRGYRRSH
jgi:predicted nucleic acid-binding protein